MEFASSHRERTRAMRILTRRVFDYITIGDMYVRMYACLCVCMYVCVEGWMYVCMYVCVGVRIRVLS